MGGVGRGAQGKDRMGEDGEIVNTERERIKREKERPKNHRETGLVKLERKRYR